MLRPSSIPRWASHLGTYLSARIVLVADRRFDPLALRPDRYDTKFLLAFSAVLGFTVLTYWSIWLYWDLQWFASEDGLTEWWTVATYLAAAGMSVATTRALRRAGHTRLGAVNVVLAVTLVVAALEEISWGQRIFGWSTPESFAAINVQNETTIHNITEFDRIQNTIFLLAAVLGMGGGVARAVLHRHGRVTSADFLLPSLVLVPALILIAAWKAGGPAFLTFMERFDLRPMGGEIPEVLSGLCILLFTYANLRRAGALQYPRRL